MVYRECGSPAVGHSKGKEVMSVLCKLEGYLFLMSTTEAKEGIGKCPVCRGNRFRDAPHGWVECETDECDFAVLEEHLKRLPDDVTNLIGAYI